jgi:tRNA(Met) C34 N-acetyltransferase TmcA
MTSIAQRTRKRRSRAQGARANTRTNRPEDARLKQRLARAAENAVPGKNSALHRLHNVLSREQYEAGCRLRDDWLDHLDAKSGGIPSDGSTGGSTGIPHERLLRQGAALARYNAAAGAVAKEYRSCVIAVCAGDRHPADLARRLETVTEAAIVLALRKGLDELWRHYQRTGR